RPLGVGRERLLPRVEQQAAHRRMPEQGGQASGGILAPGIQPREADGPSRARPARLGKPLAGPGEVVVGRLGRRGDEPVEAGDARRFEQLGQCTAAAVEARAGVHERVHDHRSTLSISRRWLSYSTLRRSAGERPARRTLSSSMAGGQPGPSEPKITRSAPMRRTASAISSGYGQPDVSSTTFSRRSATASASWPWKYAPMWPNTIVASG